MKIANRHRQSMTGAHFGRACMAAAALVPMAAYGSFGGAPCKDDFGCHFLTWGVLLGVVAIPVSALIFGVLHLAFCNSERSKLNQIFLGGFLGMVAYEISAACGALAAAWGKAASGQRTDYLIVVLVSTYLVLAVASVLYARSSPRHLQGEGGDA